VWFKHAYIIHDFRKSRKIRARITQYVVRLDGSWIIAPFHGSRTLASWQRKSSRVIHSKAERSI